MVPELQPSPPTFEATDLLEGFCSLVKRSPSLDGSMPMRAAQHCTPVMEGSSVGAQIQLPSPLTIAKRKSGYHVELSAYLAQLLARTDAAVRLGVENGIIEPGGYWHEMLSEGALTLRGDRLFIWTGLVVRHIPDVWLLVSGAFNRRSRVEIVPHVIASKGPVPLVLEADLAATRFDGKVWMQEEIGCVLPVRPKVKMRLTKLERELDAARSFLDYYDKSYLEEKMHHPTGRYRRMHARASKEVSPSCDARVAYFGPHVHKVKQFTRFANEEGVSRKPALPGDLDYVDICNGPPAKFSFDGNGTENIESGLAKYVASYERFFKKHFPDRPCPGVDDYLAAGSRGESILGLVPWAFTITPTGWSSVVDAYHHASIDADGMRGVIATDWFHTLGNVLKLHRAGTFTLKRGVPMMRILPIPRDLLKATWETKTLEQPKKAEPKKARRSREKA